MLARGLNRAGVGRFRAYLAGLRTGQRDEPPRELLEEPSLTFELSAEITVEDPRFSTRRALGAYLCGVLASLPPEEIERASGLWTWLSLYWFDRVCPPRSDGTRRPGRDLRHVLELGYDKRYQHLLYGPYHVYRRHGPVSLVLLSGPVHRESRIYGEIARRQNLIANRGVIEAALLLYVDRQSATLKPGCQPSRAHPGTIRRLVRVLQQLDLTYDIYGMSGPEILEVLPAEFDAWRAG